MGNHKLPKWGSRKEQVTVGWPAPERPVDPPEPAFVVGAMISAVNVDIDNRETVEVILGSAQSEILDLTGAQTIDWYRMPVGLTNTVIKAFFSGITIAQSGEYQNPLFRAELVIDGNIVGHDTNPDDLSRPVSVVEGHLMFLADAMAKTPEEDTEMRQGQLLVDLPSVLYPPIEHKAGSPCVLLEDLGETFLVEVQAEKFQECLELPPEYVELTDPTPSLN